MSKILREMKKDKAFTLIELLVVIAVIGMLSSIVLVSLKGVRAKARDAQRVATLNQIRVALELYYDQYGTYPDNTDSGDVGCWWLWDAGSILNGENDPFIKPLCDSGILCPVPIERNPISGGGWQQCSFRYAKQPDPVCGCPQRYAVLYTWLETDSVPAARGDERPDCIKACWGEGAYPNDYAIYLPY
jgi:prepilin-type N-terminal cleavage/methylation domain-containing protein